jgi:hypothetical protein
MQEVGKKGGVKAQENIKVMLDKGDLYAIFT